MCYKCDADDMRRSNREAEKVVASSPLEGMQYRTSPLGYWKNVEPGQKTFSVYSVNTIEFRNKPKMVATVTYDTNTAIFYSEEDLKRAIAINIQNGTKFDLKVEYK